MRGPAPRPWSHRTAVPRAPGARAAAFIPAKTGSIPELPPCPRSANLRARGAISASSSSHLAEMSPAISDWPVTLPPGRARLATTPEATGSPSGAKTIGIAVVSRIAARVAVVVTAMITSGCIAKSSRASPGSRSRSPPLNRASSTRLRPTSQPSSRSRPRNSRMTSSFVASLPSTRTATRAWRASRCVNAGGATVVAKAARSSCRRLIRSPGRRERAATAESCVRSRRRLSC
jgi:hypothetical protein